jgi:restriction endonuclease Mrr
MLPIMKIAQDGAEHTARELREKIAKSLALSDRELKELLPSGQQHGHLAVAAPTASTTRGLMHRKRLTIDG